MLNNKVGLSNEFIQQHIWMKFELAFFNFYIASNHAKEDEEMFFKAVKEKCGVEIYFEGIGRLL